MSADLIHNQGLFAHAARAHWRELGEELQADVARFNRNGGAATFSHSRENEYRAANAAVGLEVRIVADADEHIVRYDFMRMNDRSAGAPEGGILSMRMGEKGVEFYSSDQPLTPKEARSLLLDPVLNPPAC